jgi:hypothetical protein
MYNIVYRGCFGGGGEWWWCGGAMVVVWWGFGRRREREREMGCFSKLQMVYEMMFDGF